ncbi:MAG: hypothetical protein K8R69_05140, partial [Deltaproteobacteria bacterium]|nr:hypothetical protein [Deltaproteobacteria bacterium]
HPDSETLTKMMAFNQKRKSQGKSPLDIKKVTQELEAIQGNSRLNDKEKKKQVEALRKSLGLSKGEMKGMFTRRIEKVYQATEKSLKNFQETKETQLKSQLQQAEHLYGKTSPQAQAIQSKRSSLKNQMEPERHRLSEHAGFFHSLYPGFWSRLGGFFKKIGGGFLKVLGGLGAALRFLPGVGPLASSALGSVKSLLKGKIIDFGKGLLSTLKNAKSILPMIPAVGPIASLAVTGIESVMKATRGGVR